jgi:hypothetical protein
MGNQALHLPAIERDGEAAKAVEGDRAFLVAGILTAKFAGSAGTPWWGRCAKPMAPISRQASAATCGSIPCAAARVPLSRKSSKESNRLATRHGVRLRQSYSRVAKRAATMASRYAHAKQFRRHQRQLRILRSRLGRIIRDIRRKIEGQPALEEAFALPLGRATQIRSQQQRQRGWKLYSFHAPEVECIGKGKAAAPCERRRLNPWRTFIMAGPNRRIDG